MKHNQNRTTERFRRLESRSKPGKLNLTQLHLSTARYTVHNLYDDNNGFKKDKIPVCYLLPRFLVAGFYFFKKEKISPSADRTRKKNKVMVFEVDNDTVHIFVQHTHMHTVYTYVYIGKEKYTVYICSGH